MQNDNKIRAAVFAVPTSEEWGEICSNAAECNSTPAAVIRDLIQDQLGELFSAVKVVIGTPFDD